MSVRGGVRSFVRSATGALRRVHVGRVVCDEIIESARMCTQTVTHLGTTLSFAVPNVLNQFRVDSFATKEPETLQWIDGIPSGAVLWDVGANVGLYACYAAKARNCRVIAFEPSVFNLELLSRNIFLNGLTERVTLVPLPLSSRVAESTLSMTSMQWGGALSTFGESYGFDGRPLDKIFECRTIGLSMDDAIEKLGLPYPDYIKMDVDGIEHLILGGGPKVLHRVRGLSVEINDAFEAQANQSKTVLESAGLRFISKQHSEMIEGNQSFNRTFNQVWAR